MPELKTDGLKFPLKVDQIPKFEALNPDIAIHVWCFDLDHALVPLYHSKFIDRKNVITLLLLTEDYLVDAHGLRTDKEEGAKLMTREHYTYVKNTSALVNHLTKHKQKVFVCPNCMHRFTKKGLLEKHEPDCMVNKPCRIRFPSNKVKEKKSDAPGADDDLPDMQEVQEIEDLLQIDSDVRKILQNPPSVAISKLDGLNSHDQMMEDFHAEIEAEEEAKQKDGHEKFPENVLAFKAYKNCHPVPFAIYADFESFIVKHEDGTDHHEPSGFACLRVSNFGFLNREKVYTYSGPDVMSHFFQHIRKEQELICEILDEQVPMTHLTEQQQFEYDSAVVCGTCKKEFSEASHKVKHHCHVTGDFLGATCNSCNLQLKPKKKFKRKPREEWSNDEQPEGEWVWKNPPKNQYEANCRQITDFVDNEMKEEYFIPIILHNFSKYDSHIILKHMEKSFLDGEVKVIAANTESFIAVDIGKLRFMDSLRFLSASLDSLVNNLKKNGTENFLHTKRHYPNKELFAHVTSKGVYPYEFMDSTLKFEETQLPPIEAFYSKLYETSISQEEYDRAQTIWKAFNIQNMKEYHDLYLATDTILLADVFEFFRQVSFKNYGLDPAHYYTTPGLSLAACLKTTEARIELFTHPRQLQLVERGIRGGISTICNRFSCANNPYVEGYDPSQPTKYIMYLDANNLYGYAMSEPLPVGNMKFLSEEEILKFNLSAIPENSDEGFILDVDLRYPAELHDLHNSYPLAAESLSITADMHSPYAKKLLEKLGRKPCAKTEKLVPNLMDKFNYVVHYRNLQFYVKMGLIVTKIHQIMSFRQAPWIAPYIKFNSDKRREAKSPFEKDFYKLLNNALYGKQIENLRKRLDIRLVGDQIQAERLIAQPAFDDFRIINDDITMVKLRQTKITWNKPTQVGFCILELSKLLMYQFHYQHILKRYGSNAKLLFTDTDSLCYEIITPDIYADMKEDINLYDTSDYPKDHPNYSAKNCKVIGKFKDECNGVPPVEFVGLRAKMYSILLPGDKTKSVAKGIKTGFAKRHIKHALYKKCLFEECTTNASYFQIGSKNHQLSTNQIKKSALSPFDDKRYLLSGSTDTLAHGHYKIAQMRAAKLTL